MDSVGNVPRAKYDWGSLIVSLILVAGCFIPSMPKLAIGAAAFLGGWTIASSIDDYRQELADEVRKLELLRKSLGIRP